jgi:glucan phosphoethanolaminetransferase (alkaline phosphatase superfamily)
MDSEAHFKSKNERLSSMAGYYGLCSWLDHNIGEILCALDASGMTQTTTVIYTSDHGDNLGARGLWGKSNLYQESVSVPMIMAEPDIPASTCDTLAAMKAELYKICDLETVDAQAFADEITHSWFRLSRSLSSPRLVRVFVRDWQRSNSV